MVVKQDIEFYSPTILKSYNLDKTMRYQLNMLGNLDLFTKRHSENVANLTCRMCEYLHAGKSFTINATICAYLHDIGKMFIPPEVLQKPGKLTDEEYAIMKTHTTLGYEMCMKDLKLRPYAAGAIYHHEALNGSGYPRGLTKKDIPYEGQIIRVADEYDAIVSKRQYKTHIGISDTLKILIENAQNGKNNPLIVRKLFKVVIEDIEYEIYSIQTYLDDLSGEIQRLKQIEKYEQDMNKAKTDKKKQYFLEGMKMLLRTGETVENYHHFIEEYENAYKIRKDNIDTLHKEIKIIKKLKV